MLKGFAISGPQNTFADNPYMTERPRTTGNKLTVLLADFVSCPEEFGILHPRPHFHDPVPWLMKPMVQN